MEPGEKIELAVTPDRFTTVRYAGASGDFNPIHIDEEFAREVGLPGRILHGLWIMAQVARAHTDAAGGPEHLKRLSVQFRGMGRMEETITITGSVRDVTDGVALVNSNAEQAGSRIIRGAEAVLELAVDAGGAAVGGGDASSSIGSSPGGEVEVAAEGAGATVDASDATSIGSSPGGGLPGAGDPAGGEPRA